MFDSFFSGIFQQQQLSPEEADAQLKRKKEEGGGARAQHLLIPNTSYVQPFTPCQLRFAVLLFLDGWWLMPAAAMIMAAAMVERLHRMACILASLSPSQSEHDDLEGQGEEEVHYLARADDDDDDEQEFHAATARSGMRRRENRSTLLPFHGPSFEEDDDDKEEAESDVAQMFRRAQMMQQQKEEKQADNDGGNDDMAAMFRRARASAGGEPLGEMI